MFVSVNYIKSHYREFKICQNCMAINVIRKRKCIACGSTNLLSIYEKVIWSDDFNVDQESSLTFSFHFGGVFINEVRKLS